MGILVAVAGRGVAGIGVLLPGCCQNRGVVAALLPNSGVFGRDIAEKGDSLPGEIKNETQRSQWAQRNAKKDIKQQQSGDGVKYVIALGKRGIDYWYYRQYF